MYVCIHLTWCAWQASSNWKNQLVVCSLTSIFSSPPKSSLQINLPPPFPYLMDLNPLQSGWSTYTGLLILCCVGCQPNWQSGLVSICRMSWFPDKADQRAEPGSGWTPAELNHILQTHVVAGTLTTFGCVEWESNMCRGVMCARCYPFDLSKQHFHRINPKVMYIHCTYIVHTWYTQSIYIIINIHIMYIHGIYIVHTSMYLNISL